MTIVGEDSRSMPVFPATRMDFRVVLVDWGGGCIAAYRGSGPPEWVARSGDILTLIGAEAHFPDIRNFMKENEYRYGEP